MILYPLVVGALGLDHRAAGIFLGGTIHDVAQVVGAGYSVSPETGDSATIVKLLRVAMLLPVCLALGLALHVRGSAAAHAAPVLPWFAVAFAALVVVTSLGWIPSTAIEQALSSRDGASSRDRGDRHEDLAAIARRHGNEAGHAGGARNTVPCRRRPGSARVEVKVWRGGETGAYQSFEVPRGESQTVLDVVTYIQRHLDATLSYRFACRVGMCGSCAMTVNGVPRWTCRTHVDKVAREGKLEIAPLANLPVVKDLVADMREFFDKWARARGHFKPSASRADPFAQVKPDTRERIEADAGIECIGCGVCYAACDVVKWNRDYLGPAALNRAWTLVNDARDAGQASAWTPSRAMPAAIHATRS